MNCESSANLATAMPVNAATKNGISNVAIPTGVSAISSATNAIASITRPHLNARLRKSGASLESRTSVDVRRQMTTHVIVAITSDTASSATKFLPTSWNSQFSSKRPDGDTVADETAT